MPGSSRCLDLGQRDVASASRPTVTGYLDFSWNVSKEIRTFRGHAQEISSVAFSPDGRMLLTSSHDNTVRLWDVDAGTEVKRFEDHTYRVEGAAFSCLLGEKSVSESDWETGAFELYHPLYSATLPKPPQPCDLAVLLCLTDEMERRRRLLYWYYPNLLGTRQRASTPT